MLVDDHRVLTDVLAMAIDREADLTCVAVAHSLLDALAKAAAYEFDVALVDLQLPDGGGLSIIGALLERCPQARVVILTGHPRADLERQAYERGASAFLAKDGALPDLLAVIRGERTCANRSPGAIARPDPQRPVRALTPREHEVLALIAGGNDARQIARTLGLSLHTVRDYIKAILAKLDAHTQLDAVVIADRLGLIAIGERLH